MGDRLAELYPDRIRLNTLSLNPLL